MDKKTVFIKTDKGEREADSLSSDLKRILMLIDNKSASGDLSKRAPPSLRDSWNDILKELMEGGYIRDKNRAEPKIVAPKSKFNPLKLFSSKPAETFVNKAAAQPPSDDLDFSAPKVVPASDAAELAAKQKAEEAARARVEREVAAVAVARASTEAAARAEAEAKAKQEAELLAKAKALAEAKAKQEALLREQAEAKTKQEAKARQEETSRKLEEQEAARTKASLEAALRVRAEIETAARAQKEAEAKAKQEAEAARLKIQHEAARAKAAAEVAARTKAEAEARVRAEVEAAARAKQEAEVLAKREVEAVRLKAEQEAARIKSELEAVAKAKQEAEAARLKAEETAALARAELEAVKARAEAEAKAMAEMMARKMAEEKAKQEAETARLIAEQEAARIRAEQEAVAKIQTEAEARARAEVEAKLRAEAEVQARTEVEAKLRADADALARRQEAEALAKREAEEHIRRAAVVAEQEKLARITKEISAPAFEINLDSFLGGAGKVNQTVAPASGQDTQAGLKARQEAEQRAAAEAVAKAEAEIESMKNAAAEMARLKEEAETARRIAEDNARRQAEEQALAEEQTKAWAEAEHRAKAQAILEAGQAAQQAALAQAKSRKKQPVERAYRKPLPLGKIAFGVIMLALIGVLVLPYVYPLNDYIAPIEQRLTQQLKQPVHIGGISASSLPPKLQFKNVTVGSSQEVKVGAVELNFDPLALFSQGKVINNLEMDDVSINGSMLTKQVASLKLLGGDAQYPVRHLTLQRVNIVTDEVSLPSMNGIADIDVQGAFSRISLHSPDDKLGFDLQANQGNWQLGVNLKESPLPLFPDVLFSDFSAKGDLSDGEVNFTEMDAHIYNGILLGSAKLNWRKGWQLQGRFEAKTFELNKMFPKFHVEGDMYGEGTFAAAGVKLSQLDDAPRLDGSFTVKKGTVNVDIVETARLLSRDNLVGGRTHFDDMIGLVQLENHSIHIKQLKIVSGMMSANGSFDVSSTNQLTGNLNAEIKMRPGINPLTLYGELAEPKLRAGH